MTSRSVLANVPSLIDGIVKGRLVKVCSAAQFDCVTGVGA